MRSGIHASHCPTNTRLHVARVGDNPACLSLRIKNNRATHAMATQQKRIRPWRMANERMHGQTRVLSVHTRRWSLASSKRAVGPPHITIFTPPLLISHHTHRVRSVVGVRYKRNDVYSGGCQGPRRTFCRSSSVMTAAPAAPAIVPTREENVTHTRAPKVCLIRSGLASQVKGFVRFIGSHTSPFPPLSQGVLPPSWQLLTLCRDAFILSNDRS